MGSKRRVNTTEDFEITKPKITKKVESLSNFHLDLKFKNEKQKLLSQSIKNNDVTICTGPAGTGKTYISVFEALIMLKNHPDIYKQIKLVKSITQLKNEDLGTLPGDEKDKLKFHMMSYLDAFYKLIGEGLTNKLIEANVIKFEVFGAIRGRSFSNAIILVDEFQNINHDNAKTFLTRFEPTTKVIVLGDIDQIDLKNKNESSLERLITRVKNHPDDSVGVIEFDETEIVRHRLTSYFINIFKEPKQNQPQPKQIVNDIPKEKSSLQKFTNFFK